MSDKQKIQLSELNRYLVGGAVRDRLLNIDRSDKDWVVVGTTEATMLSLGFRPIGRISSLSTSRNARRVRPCKNRTKNG